MNPRALIAAPMIAALVVTLLVFNTGVLADSRKDEIARGAPHKGVPEAIASQPKTPPVDALSPTEISDLPAGSRASELTLPATYGQFRILPAGSVPNSPPLALFGNPTSIDPWSVATVNDVPKEARGLLRMPSYMPAGWTLSEISGQSATYPDGTKQGIGTTLNYQRAGSFPIRVSRGPVTNEPYDIVNPGSGTKHAITLSTVNGTQAVKTHQAPGQHIQAKMSIIFINQGAYTSVWWPAADFDHLERIAASLTAQQ